MQIPNSTPKRYQLAVCDDEPASLRALSRLVSVCCGEDCAITEYTDPKQLLASKALYHIAVVDIQMEKLDGITLAGELTKRNPGCQIIFVSGYTDYVTEVYDTPHLCYILKDKLAQKLPHYLERARQQLEQADSALVAISVHGATRLLRQSSILYIERSGRLTRIVSTDDTLETYDKLEAVSAQLDPVQFCRCHYSIVVNLAQVRSYERNRFVLNNGKEIPISRAYTEQARAGFTRYVGERVL